MCDHSNYKPEGKYGKLRGNFCGDCGSLLSVRGAWGYLRPRSGPLKSLNRIRLGASTWIAHRIIQWAK